MPYATATALGTEFPLPQAAQRDSITNKQGERALGGDGKVYLSRVANGDIDAHNRFRTGEDD